MALEPEKLKIELKLLVTENRDLTKKLQDLQNDRVSEMFQIDANPGDDDPVSGGVDPPPDMEVLGNDSKTDEDKKESKVPTKSCCFNCNGDDHMIADCPKPRDPRTIAQNRRKFMKSQPLSAPRYHVDETQRFAHIKPGSHPSKALRSALDLRDSHLPSYVYRMRELGYPPGWKKEAEIRRSGVNLYLTEEKQLPDLGDEEGEVFEEGDKVVYDKEKVVVWPGFNGPMPDGIRDDCDRYHCPALSEEQSVDKMLAEMEGKEQTGYIRGEMQNTSTLTHHDDDDNQEEVGNGGAENPFEAFSDAEEQRVKSVDEGTPIVSAHSAFSTLPDQSKWAKDVTDHILFENLPDSTGKWEQMRKVLGKVRKE